MSFAATADSQDLPPSALRAWDRRFAVVLLLSLLLHLTLITTLHRQEPVDAGAAAPRGPLNVRLQPRADPPPPAEATPPPPPKPVQRSLMTSPRRNPERPALPPPPPEPPPVEPPPKSIPPPPQPAPQMSFEEMVAARRAQRAPTVSEHAAAREAAEAGGRSDAILTRNLGTLKADGTSGVFEVINKGSRYGTFRFNGWKREASNKWRETFEVDAGLNGDVELALVRRMIDVIRLHYQGDFNWESKRLGRVVVLSARPQDQAGLESFMLREFFKERP